MVNSTKAFELLDGLVLIRLDEFDKHVKEHTQQLEGHFWSAIIHEFLDIVIRRENCIQ